MDRKNKEEGFFKRGVAQKMKEKTCPFCKTSEGIEIIVYGSGEHNYPGFKGKDVVCIHCAVCSKDIKISEFEGGAKHGSKKKNL
jgi:hypothetical protein